MTEADVAEVIKALEPTIWSILQGLVIGAVMGVVGAFIGIWLYFKFW